MTACPQSPHKAVDGQRYTIDFWRVSFGNVGKAHDSVTTSNIDAYDMPVGGARQKSRGSPTASEPQAVLV
jgi:hypothetical protein